MILTTLEGVAHPSSFGDSVDKNTRAGTRRSCATRDTAGVLPSAVSAATVVVGTQGGTFAFDSSVPTVDALVVDVSRTKGSERRIRDKIPKTKGRVQRANPKDQSPPTKSLTSSLYTLMGGGGQFTVLPCWSALIRPVGEALSSRLAHDGRSRRWVCITAKSTGTY